LKNGGCDPIWVHVIVPGWSPAIPGKRASAGRWRWRLPSIHSSSRRVLVSAMGHMMARPITPYSMM